MTDPSPLRLAIQLIAQGQTLSREASRSAFEVLMQGDASRVQAAALLLGLRARGETAEELAGAVSALRGAMIRLEWDEPQPLVDTCGTGGGTVSTLNISTAAAFVVAGAGVPVAKHGNRSYTSKTGSADVLEALGVDIHLSPSRARAVLRSAGLVFLFAPDYHPAMRHLAPVRKELGVATIMNLVGPLANPAGVARQVVGVADASRGGLMAASLALLGAEHALVLHGEVGMDEISPSGRTLVWEVCEGLVRNWELSPGEFGLACDELDGLRGGEPSDNASRIEALLLGRGTAAERCAVVLNSAAALYVSGRGWSFAEAADRSRQALEKGAGARVLDRLRAEAPAGSRN